LSSRFFGPDAWGPLAAAWVAFWEGHETVVLRIRSDDSSPEAMPVSIFFRSGGDLRPIDREALARVRGRVLDGGAGVGSLALILQERGVPVVAAEIIPEGVAIMKERGVREVIGAPLETLQPEGAFDTILLLMNGTALAGTLRGFPAFLDTLDGLLAPGGQILMDSTDLLGGEAWAESNGRTRQGGGVSQEEYPGELHYQMEFRGERGAPFPQLFLDPGTLTRLAGERGWQVEVVREDQGGEYLACLTRQEPGKTTR
jgi:SAM-dependent methyltransferase